MLCRSKVAVVSVRQTGLTVTSYRSGQKAVVEGLRIRKVSPL